MFEGFSGATADFFWSLKFNNERGWFLEHKQEFEEKVNGPFKALAADTHAAMRARFPDMDLQLHAARIYRDARRTYGQGPYKESLWFTIQPGERHSVGPLFWFDIDGTSWSCGAGTWESSPELMAAWRKLIDADPARFLKVVDDFEALGPYRRWGEAYKRPKADRGERLNPWYNLKHVSVGYEHAFGSELYSPDLPDRLAETYAALMPMYLFFREAFQNYQHEQAEQNALALSGARAARPGEEW